MTGSIGILNYGDNTTVNYAKIWGGIENGIVSGSQDGGGINLTVVNSIISDCMKKGILAYYGRNVVIRNSEFSNNNFSAIQIYNGFYAMIIDNIINRSASGYSIVNGGAGVSVYSVMNDFKGNMRNSGAINFLN